MIPADETALTPEQSARWEFTKRAYALSAEYGLDRHTILRDAADGIDGAAEASNARRRRRKEQPTP